MTITKNKSHEQKRQYKKENMSMQKNKKYIVTKLYAYLHNDTLSNISGQSVVNSDITFDMFHDLNTNKQIG